MSKKIKIGLVGLGHLGKIHLELIRQIDHFVLSGIYDIDVKRAKSFSNKFNIKKYENIKKLISESDAIDIVTPTDTHFNIASKCLKLNKHFFIEKSRKIDFSKSVQIASPGRRGYSGAS